MKSSKRRIDTHRECNLNSQSKNHHNLQWTPYINLSERLPCGVTRSQNESMSSARQTFFSLEDLVSAPVSNSFLLFVGGKRYIWDKTHCIVDGLPNANPGLFTSPYREQLCTSGDGSMFHALRVVPWVVSPLEHVWLIRMVWWQLW